MEPVTNPKAIRTVLDASTLDAFVDGALSPEAAASVVLHLADCPGDQAYVDSVVEVNALLAAAYGEPLHQALPERLRATIFPAETPARPARATARSDWRASAIRPSRAAWGALAASVVVGFGLAAGLMPGRDPSGASLSGLAGADADLRAALEASASGTVTESVDGAQITLIATFLDRDARPCREFEVLDAAAAALTEGVACRNAGGEWMAEIAVASRLAAPAAPEDSFVTASGAGDGALGVALDRLGAGMSLTPDAERDLIAGGWAN